MVLILPFFIQRHPINGRSFANTSDARRPLVPSLS